jgi:outer membrane protein TolC
LTLNWTLFDGMKMFATRDKAERHIHLGDKVIKNQVINTIAQVINTYYGIVREKQQLRAIEDQMRLSQSRVDLTTRRLEIGAGAKPDVLQSQVDHNAQRAAQLRQQTVIEQLKENLNLLLYPERMGLQEQLSTAYDVMDTIPLDMQLTRERILNQLEAGNPLLSITKTNIEIAHLSLQEIKAERWPTIQFNSAYNFTRVNNNIALNPFLPLINQNRGFNYGFTAAIPILNYRNNHRMTRQAELNIEFQHTLYNSQRAALRLGVIQAFNDFEYQKQALELEEANILLAQENVDIVLETYRFGAATFIQLREAERSLEDAYNRLIAARYNTKVAETTLLQLSGELVK